MAFGSIFADADVGAGGFQTTASGGAGAELGFGPVSSGSSGVHPLHPGTGFGSSVWIGVGALVLLVVLRRSLPA